MNHMRTRLLPFKTSAFLSFGVALLVGGMTLSVRADASEADTQKDERTIRLTVDDASRMNQQSAYWDVAQAGPAVQGKLDRAASAIAATKPAVDYYGPYPFTSDELWQMLLKVFETPDGAITKSEVERIFGATLKPYGLFEPNPEKNGKRIGYQAKRGIDWYFGLVVIEATPAAPAKSYFVFDWDQPVLSTFCVDMSNRFADIEQRGWKVRFKTPASNHPPALASNLYRKGDTGRLRMEFASAKDPSANAPENCLYRITLTSGSLGLNEK